MIEFIKNYFTTPDYQHTPMDRWLMSIIIIGLIFVLCLIAFGIWCLVIAIENKKEQRNGRKR